jgi:signal transduction histidine kinase
VKHAQASRAEVRLDITEHQVEIVVADDGEGFDASARARPFDASGGFGLFSIRQMCAQVGGSFAIESAVGKGARATITVPRG